MLFFLVLISIPITITIAFYSSHIHNVPMHLDSHRNCMEKLMSSKWKAVCYQKNHNSSTVAPCKAFFKDMVSSPKIEWYKNCIAKNIIASGFEIPVYIVHNNNPLRYKSIMSQCKILNKTVSLFKSFKSMSLAF